MQRTIASIGAATILGIAANLTLATQAQAVACGSIEYPDCGGCTRSHVAAQSLPNGPGCEACFGICFQMRSVPVAEDAKAATVDTQSRATLKRVASANYIDAGIGTLHEIAQINPMVALAVNAYSPQYEPRAGNFKRGKMAFPAVPTSRTFQIALQSSNGSLSKEDYQMDALASSDNYAELSWTSTLLASGDLEVTYRAQEVNDDEVAIRTLYPPVKIVLSKDSPSKLLNWQLAN